MEVITKEFLAPAQVRVGQLGKSGRWPVAARMWHLGHRGGALRAGPRCDAAAGAHTRHVAVACAEGEWDSLPGRMAAAVVGASGERGSPCSATPFPRSMVHRLLSKGDIDVLALSWTMPTNLIGAARCIAAAHDLEVPVIAGA
jgi:hypothetical protein